MKDFENELNRVIGIIERAETLLSWAQELSRVYECGIEEAKNKREYMLHGPIMLAVIQINLFFQDSLLCTNTVLFGDTKENKEEIGFPYIKEKYPEELKAANPNFDARFYRAVKAYRDNHLKTVRDKIVAHKDLLTSGDAIMAFMNKFNAILMNQLLEVISTLKAIVAGFNVPRNNGFMEFYIPAYKSLKFSLDEGIRTYRTD